MDNKQNEVVVVNGMVTGVHLGMPIQDTTPDRPEDNEKYYIERNTKTQAVNSEEVLDKQPTSGGGGLPTGGEPHQQLVTDANGNAVWEEKLAYEGLIELLPETTATSGSTDIAIGTIQVWESGVLASSVKAGDKVAITLDGQTYDVTLAEGTNPFTGEMDGWLDDGSGGTALYQTADGHDVGFAVAPNPEGQRMLLICVGGDHSPFTATASLVGNGVKTIDKKFLPESAGGSKTFIVDTNGVLWKNYDGDADEFSGEVTIDDLEDVKNGWVQLYNSIYIYRVAAYALGESGFMISAQEEGLTGCTSSDYADGR